METVDVSKVMGFSAAIAEMDAGELIRRLCWDPHQFIYFNRPPKNVVEYLEKIGESSRLKKPFVTRIGYAENVAYQFSIEDVMATDWIKVE